MWAGYEASVKQKVCDYSVLQLQNLSLLVYSTPGYACREEREQVLHQICDSFAQKVQLRGFISLWQTHLYHYPKESL